MDKVLEHDKSVRSHDRRISYYKEELVEVQALFYGRRYKQCIALCEHLQRPEIHALHQAFLWLYRAISYESIGLLAHNFSKNKLQFLDSARDSFGSAVKCLPLPYVSTEAGAYEQPEDSPLNPAFEFSTSPAATVLKAGLGLCPVTPRIIHIAPSSSVGSVYSTESPCPKVDRKISEDEAPPRMHAVQEVQDEIEQESDSENQLVVPATRATHKTRLSRVLSSPQALQEELIPSPLFSRTPKPARVSQTSTGHAIPRPLPPLPFNHNTTFKIQGTRIIQHSRRKTAVQTLIARFEGILPLPLSPTPILSATLPTTLSISTPRFQMIRDAFSPDPHNAHLEVYLSSIASAQIMRYDTHLVDFRAQLRNHITCIDAEIARVLKLQVERTAQKMLGPKQRFASFWSFQAVDSPCPRRGRFTAEDEGGSDSERGVAEDAKVTAKKERIERLRGEEWRVCKERHGFKGVAFYDELARQVEAELDGRLLA